MVIPSLTLGVAVYNSSPYLDQLFASIGRLSVQPERVLFLDDCSSDDSPAKIIRFAKSHPDLSVDLIRNGTNLGIAGTYNRIVALAKTEWLQILDADDYFLNDFYLQVVPNLLPGVAAIATSFASNIRFVSLFSGLFARFVPKRVPFWLPVLGTISTRSTLIYNRTILARYPFHDPVFDGSDILNLIELRKHGELLFLRKPRVHYRIHRGSASSIASRRHYEAYIRTHHEVPWPYTLDVFLRKKLLAFVRRNLTRETKPV